MRTYIRTFLIFATASMSLAVTYAAEASPELARSWSAQAEMLGSDLQASGPVLSDALVSDLKKFGRVSARLSKSGTYEHPIPKDLGCIFRGMAEETTLQLSALKTATSDDQRIAAEKRLLKMLDDAVSVGLAAALVLEGKTPESGSTNVTATTSTCPGGNLPQDPYLTPQP